MNRTFEEAYAKYVIRDIETDLYFGMDSYYAAKNFRVPKSRAKRFIRQQAIDQVKNDRRYVIEDAI